MEGREIRHKVISRNGRYTKFVSCSNDSHAYTNLFLDVYLEAGIRECVHKRM